MAKCYAQLGVMTCDREKGHVGPHRDDWILGGGYPAPDGRQVEWSKPARRSDQPEVAA